MDEAETFISDYDKIMLMNGKMDWMIINMGNIDNPSVEKFNLKSTPVLKSSGSDVIYYIDYYDWNDISST